MPSEDCILLAFGNPSAGFHRSRRNRAELKRISRSNLQAGMLFKDIPDMGWDTLICGFQRVSNTKEIIKDPVQTEGTAVSIPFYSCLDSQRFFKNYFFPIVELLLT